jgi:sugar phosphate isomerase/epimerase
MSSTIAPADGSRLSLNSITVDQLTLEQTAELCRALGIRWIAPWRHKLADPVERTADLLRDAGLSVSSLCRGGFFPARDASARAERERDNRRALEETAALGADVLVLVCGPPANGDLARSRAMVSEGIERLVPHAASLGVRLGIEPLHPMMAAERSVIVTLAQALDVADRFDPAHVGVIVDAYHVWWDPDLAQQIVRARGRILGFHVSDWLTPTTDVLAGRGLMGDGVIDLRGLRALVEAAGYTGPIEVEIINPSLASLEPRAFVADVRERFRRHV